MYKLLLVDDNEYVLDGFREKINLGDLGIELAGVAANGEDALALIRKIDPDILVTDIKMPKMDGMELIQAVRKMGKEVKVVILSGYSDFEYARKAVSLNAVEYMLKPILKADIENTLRKIVESLKSEETEAQRQLKLEVRDRQNSEILKSHIIGNLLEGKVENRQQALDLLAGIDASLLECKAAVALLEPDTGFSQGGGEAEKRDALNGILTTVVTAAGCSCIGLAVGEKRAALLLSFAHTAKDGAIAENYADTLCRIHEAVKRRHGLSISLSAGQAVPDILDMRKSYLQAGEAMKYSLTLGRNRIIMYSDILKLDGVKSSRFDQSVKKAADTVLKGAKADAFSAVDEFYDGVAVSKDCKPADVINASYKLALCSMGLLEGRDAGISETALWEQLNALETLEEIRVWMKGIFTRVFQSFENKKRYSRIVNLVIDSIDRDYAKELLLKDMAEELYISTNYLTTLFKKETGVSFKKYMTNVRMRKAMELLMDPQYKVYEIAGLIGYESEEHFCRMFKENAGVTPKEYKNSGIHGKLSPASR